MWKFVGASKVLVIYIYIYIYNEQSILIGLINKRKKKPVKNKIDKCKLK